HQQNSARRMVSWGSGIALAVPDFRSGRTLKERRRGLIPKLQRAEDLPTPGDFLSQQLVAGICVLLERRLIGEIRRALGGDHARGGTASYSFGSDESGNLGIVIVVRHDLSLRAG